jgi:Flp pilus assembly protein CpaB
MAERMRLTETAMGNGARADALPRGELRVEPPASGPRHRVPELVLGIFLVAGCALAALLLAASARERTPVLALSRDVARGQEITADDLRTVYVGSDSEIAYLSQGAEDEVVGKAALSDLPAGTLVIPEQFAERPAVLDGSTDGIVGLDLEIGQMPTNNLAPGDHVRVVAGGDTSGEQADVVADTAQVVSVERIEDDSGQAAHWAVSLRASENDATAIAQAKSGDNPVELVLVQR